MNKKLKLCHCKEASSPHMHTGDFQKYWSQLSESEKQSLRDKSRWEAVSLSAVASEWGAVSEQSDKSLPPAETTSPSPTNVRISKRSAAKKEAK